jgi:hypothetical protein
MPAALRSSLTINHVRRLASLGKSGSLGAKSASHSFSIATRTSWSGKTSDVIEEILQHCGLWQSSTPRAPPDVDGLVLELDAAYSASSIDSSDQVDRSQELTYVDIDTFLASF